MRSASQSLRPAAEALASQLPPLLVAAERIAANVAQGVHGRRQVGPGDAFWQYRRYQSGDSVSHIDWRASAKTPHLYVREHEWEAAETVRIWCDQSPSMDYQSRSNVLTKADRAAILALGLACVLLRGGERVALLTNDPGLDRPLTGRSGLSRLALQLEGLRKGQDHDLPRVRNLGRHGRIVMIGDFLHPAADVTDRIAGFSALGLKGHLLQVLDPAEEDPKFTGRVELSDPESQRRLVLGRAESLHAEYRGRLDALRAQITQSAHAHHWTFMRHNTHQSAQAALLGLYAVLSGPDLKTQEVLK